MSDVAVGVFNVKHDKDPAKEILNSIGDISQIRVAQGKVLLGIYKRPEKTGGGIIRPNSAREEDVFQGKTWLVLAKGPLCFEDSDHGLFGGFKADVGEWVLARNSDGYRCDIGGTGADGGYQCLLIDHKYIKGVVPSPYMVW